MEAQSAIALAIDLIALLVDGAMVPAAEQGEIREGRGTSVGPVAEVMTLPEGQPAAGEATPTVPMLKRPP
jgi:hypothetical protein